MLTNQLLIIGAGGHARVVLDAARCGDDRLEIFIRDDNLDNHGKNLDGIIVQAPVGLLSDTISLIHIAIGNNSARSQISQKLFQFDKQFHTVIHPQALISKLASISPGCFIAARAILAPGAQINMGTIINHAAIVDHDCRVGAWAHIAPNVTLGGNVTIGDRCLIGAGAIILPGVTVGNDSIVGAGAVVTKNVLSGQVIMGVPAKVRVKEESSTW